MKNNNRDEYKSELKWLAIHFAYIIIKSAFNKKKTKVNTLFLNIQCTWSSAMNIFVCLFDGV
jgi:hypothetical protein